MIEAHVDALTGKVSYITSPSTSITVQQAQQQQISIITNSYKNAIKVFQSSGTGTTYTYLADDTSMNKFNAEYTYANSTSYGGENINWYTVEVGGVTHTKTQFCQVWLDGRSYLTNQFNKWDSLIKQINACTDVNSVQAITW